MSGKYNNFTFGIKRMTLFTVREKAISKKKNGYGIKSTYKSLFRHFMFSTHPTATKQTPLLQSGQSWLHSTLFWAQTESTHLGSCQHFWHTKMHPNVHAWINAICPSLKVPSKLQMPKSYLWLQMMQWLCLHNKITTRKPVTSIWATLVFKW